MTTWRLFGWVTIAALFLSACGSAHSGPNASPAPTTTAMAASSWDTSDLPDPCRVITSAEVINAVGQNVAAGTRLESWPPLCEFLTASVPQSGVYISDDSAATGKADFDQRRQGVPVQTVDGIGDQAYWVPSYNTLHVLKGDTHLEVIVKLSDDSAQMAQAEAVARIALPRALPQ